MSGTVYAYTDFREFLRDKHALRVGRNPSYSMRAWARKLGLDSGQLTRILEGKRGLTARMLPRFVADLHLSKPQAQYFAGLVALCQARSEAERGALHDQLALLRRHGPRRLAAGQLDVFSDWYTPVLRELLVRRPLRGDGRDLGKLLLPPVSGRQARAAVRALRAAGLLAAEGAAAAQPQVSTGLEWRSAAMHSFQRRMAQFGVDALARFPKAQRDVSTITAAFSPKGFDRAREALAKLRAELLRIEQEDVAHDRIYHVNLQLFPVTRPFKGEPQ